MISANELAEQMKIEILQDVANGIVPDSVGSFSELHDYVDANLYGGTEALLEELDAGGTTDEEHCAALSKLCDLANPAMDAVDSWIKAGGVAHALQHREQQSPRPDRPVPYAITRDGDQLAISDDQGAVIARLPLEGKKLAHQIAHLPLILWTVEQLLDGVEGYLSEHGANRYWLPESISEARRLTKAQ